MADSSTLEGLAAFQDDLVRLLEQGVPHQALCDHIREVHGEPWASWVDGFDPRSVDIAHRILLRWARHRSAM